MYLLYFVFLFTLAMEEQMTKAKNNSAILITSVENKCWIKSRPSETLDLSAICWQFSQEKNMIINFRHDHEIVCGTGFPRCSRGLRT